MRTVVHRGICAAALAAMCSNAGHAQSLADARYARAFGKLYETSQLGGLVKAWCDARAPMARTTTDSAIVAWKSTHQLMDIEQRADTVLGAQAAGIRSRVEARRASVFRALDKDSKAPEADCRQLLSYLDRSANPQRLHAAEYRLVDSRRTAGTSTLRTASQAAEVAVNTAVANTPVANTPVANASPIPTTTTRATGLRVSSRGTVHTVAQLSALVEQDTRTAEARLKRMGRIVVQGTLEVYDTTRTDETVWLNTLRDGWRSTTSVLCYDFSFRRLYNANRRAITVRGSVREVGSWIQLEDCEVLTDVSGLVASTRSDSGGSERIDVAPAQLRTAPNAGVTMAQVEGIYQPSKLRYNPMSMLYEGDERTYLVLKDGWLYDNLGVSPHDLDVATSRRLEPQHWHRWRRQGTRLEIMKSNEYGRTDGRWTVLELTSRPPISAGRLNGMFSATSSATVGMAGGGGATSVGRTSYTFRPDGTFEWANFTQSFASSGSGTGQGGTTVVVGGTSSGPGGTFSSSVGGGNESGTYTIDGYTLELRTRRGEVLRYPLFSWDTGKYRDYLVINGTSYSPPTNR
jgi:hypothetical protein